MKKTKKLIAVCFALLAVTAAFCAIGVAEEIFYFAGDTGSPSLDPCITDSGTAHNLILNVLEKLIRFTPGTAEIEPALATSWDISDDLKTYTFYLREGVCFTDGTPFNADAVAINMERALALNRGAAIRLQEVDAVNVIDDYTVEFVLKAPSVPFLYKLAGSVGLNIISPKAIKDHATSDDPWATEWLHGHLVGTGPYIMQEWVPEDRAVLVKNEDYWRGWEGKHFDTVIKRVVPEWTTRQLLLLQNEVQMVQYPEPEALPSLETTPGITVVPVPTINVAHFVFNLYVPIMQNKKFREALSWAFPYKDIEAIAGMGSSQLQGPMPEVIGGHNDSLFVYNTDLDKAAQSLKEAGYQPGEVKIEFAYYTLDRNRRFGETFQANLAQIGIELELVEMLWAQFAPWLDAPKEDVEVEIAYVEHWAEYPEATNYLSFLFEDSELSKPYCPRGYKNEKLNELVIQARSTVDVEKRNELYREAQELIMDDVLSIYALQMSDAVVLRDNVQGFVATPPNFGIFDFYLMHYED